MITSQRGTIRFIEGERAAKLASAIERLKKAVPSPVSWADDQNNITEYRDPAMQRLSFRVFVHKLSPLEKAVLYKAWFFKTPW